MDKHGTRSQRNRARDNSSFSRSMSITDCQPRVKVGQVLYMPLVPMPHRLRIC